MRTPTVLLTVVVALLIPWFRLTAQQAKPVDINLSQAQIAALAQEIADSQARFLINAGKGVAYRARWVDHEDDYSREVIGSSDGRVDRVLTEKGRPLSAARNSKEQQRLTSLLKPEHLRSETKSSARLLPYFLELVRAMPKAMLFQSPVSQPQLPDVSHAQFVLDYSPNPTFHPKSLTEATLRKLRGRVWIDAVDHHLLRIDIQMDQDVNVVGGVLIKVYRGGTITYDQRLITGGQYSWTHLRLHLQLRELLVKTSSIDAELTASDIRLLSPIPNGPEAIHALLAMDIDPH